MYVYKCKLIFHSTAHETEIYFELQSSKTIK